MIWLICAAASCACGSPPEEVVGRFYDLCAQAKQGDFDQAQAQIFPLLSRASRDQLDDCANRVNLRLSRPRVSPSDCLILSGYLGGRGARTIARVVNGTERIRFEITHQGRTRFLEVVFEEGWKIDLPASAELNSGDSQPAPESS